MIDSATTTLSPRARIEPASQCEAKPFSPAQHDPSMQDLVAQLTRIDLHCHSSASNKPVNRAVGLLTNMPESYSPPEKVYDQAIARGMDLVTITDHDTIAGVLSLVDRGFENIVIGQGTWYELDLGGMSGNVEMRNIVRGNGYASVEAYAEQYAHIMRAYMASSGMGQFRELEMAMASMSPEQRQAFESSPFFQMVSETQKQLSSVPESHIQAITPYMSQLHEVFGHEDDDL